MSHSILNSLERSQYFSQNSLFLIFSLWFAGMVKFSVFFFFWFIFLLISPRSGFSSGFACLLASKISEEFYVSHSIRQILVCACTIWLYGQISVFLHDSQWITFPTQACVDIYSLCTLLLHWLIVSFLSPHYLRFLFWGVLLILALIELFFLLPLEEIQFLY